MSKIDSKLTAERLRELLHYDPETGNFTRRIATVRGSRFVAGTIAGSQHVKGYLTIFIDGQAHKCHRLAFLHMTGEWPPYEHVDHVNGRRADNRWVNLRAVPRTINIQNQRAPKAGSKTGFLGVYLERNGKFRTEITANGERRYLGTYESADAAYRVYLAAKRQLHLGNTL